MFKEYPQQSKIKLKKWIYSVYIWFSAVDCNHHSSGWTTKWSWSEIYVPIWSW